MHGNMGLCVSYYLVPSNWNKQARVELVDRLKGGEGEGNGGGAKREETGWGIEGGQRAESVSGLKERECGEERGEVTAHMSPSCQLVDIAQSSVRLFMHSL